MRPIGNSAAIQRCAGPAKAGRYVWIGERSDPERGCCRNSRDCARGASFEQKGCGLRTDRGEHCERAGLGELYVLRRSLEDGRRFCGECCEEGLRGLAGHCGHRRHRDGIPCNRRVMVAATSGVASSGRGKARGERAARGAERGDQEAHRQCDGGAAGQEEDCAEAHERIVRGIGRRRMGILRGLWACAELAHCTAVEER